MNVIRPLTAAACLALIALTGGCAVSVIDPGKPDASAPAESTTSSSSSDAPEQEDTAADDAAPSREQLISGATRVLRCDGVLTIIDDGVSVYVEGDCEHLILNSSGSQVAADDVALLEVIGDANVVLTGEIGELLVNGTGNVVHWTGETPSVSDIGDANVLTAG